MLILYVCEAYRNNPEGFVNLMIDDESSHVLKWEGIIIGKIGETILLINTKKRNWHKSFITVNEAINYFLDNWNDLTSKTGMELRCKIDFALGEDAVEEYINHIPDELFIGPKLSPLDPEYMNGLPF